MNEKELPCGATGYLDGVGIRCADCLLIYGSAAWIGSACPNAIERRRVDAVAAGDGCVRTIVRTGQPDQDAIASALESASFEDLALLVVAINRSTTGGGGHADADVQR